MANPSCSAIVLSLAPDPQAAAGKSSLDAFVPKLVTLLEFLSQRGQGAVQSGSARCVCGNVRLQMSHVR